MKTIRGMTAAAAVTLALACAFGATTPSLAQSADPSEVTQTELDIVEAEYSTFIDAAAVQLQASMRQILLEQAGELPDHMRDSFKASFNRSMDGILPQLRRELSRGFAMTFTLAELENDLAVSAERQAVVGPRGREIGEGIGRRVARDAWLGACDDIGAPAATECANIRKMLDQIAPAQ